MDTRELADRLDQVMLDAAFDETNRQFIAAWQGWRGPGRLLPKRSAVELGDIKQLLGRVILLELISQDQVLVYARSLSPARDQTLTTDYALAENERAFRTMWPGSKLETVHV